MKYWVFDENDRLLCSFAKREDASLAAAAPELFAALQMVMKDCKNAAITDNACEYDAISTETFNAIVAALAKAKGGQNG